MCEDLINIVGILNQKSIQDNANIKYLNKKFQMSSLYGQQKIYKNVDIYIIIKDTKLEQKILILKMLLLK